MTDGRPEGEPLAQTLLAEAITIAERTIQHADQGLLPKTDEARGRLQLLLAACRGLCDMSMEWPSVTTLRERLGELCDRLTPFACSPELRELEQLYRRVMGPVDSGIPSYDFVAGRFAVRFWDGMDGCWLDVAADVSGEEALRTWSKRTEGGTTRTRFAHIDYVRLFPADVKMIWDGRVGREMFR